MPENELISAYLDGLMDRRQFIKRLVALGVSAAAAGAYAQAFATRAAEADIRRDENGFFVADSVSATEYAAPQIQPTSPISDTADRTPTIRADIYDNLNNNEAPLDGIAKRGVRLRLDGVRRDRFALRNVGDGLYRLSFTPESRLSYGEHTVKISVTDNGGHSSSATTWAFRIVRR